MRISHWVLILFHFFLFSTCEKEACSRPEQPPYTPLGFQSLQWFTQSMLFYRHGIFQSTWKSASHFKCPHFMGANYILYPQGYILLKITGPCIFLKTEVVSVNAKSLNDTVF